MARKLSQSSIRVNCNLVLRLQPQMETKIHRNICYSRRVLPYFFSTHTLIEKSSYFLPDCLLGMQKLSSDASCEIQREYLNRSPGKITLEYQVHFRCPKVKCLYWPTSPAVSRAPPCSLSRK